MGTGDGDRDGTAGVRVFVLGPVSLATNGTRVALRGQQGALLCALAAAHPSPISTETLIESIWPTSAPKAARSGLRVIMHRLRERVGDADAIVHEGHGYRLALADTQLDHKAFVAALETAQSHHDAERFDDAVTVLREALATWRGQAFQPHNDQPALAARANHFEELRRSGEELVVSALLSAGRPDEAAIYATGLVEAEPYRERRWELLMLALYRCGRQAEALQAAQSAARILREDLGIEPCASLRELESAILVQAPHLAAERSVDGVDELVMGLGRLTDPVPPTTTSFIGRDDDLERLVDLAERPGIITVVGPPGVGKTRLVAQYARGTVQRRVVWLDLVDIEPDSVAVEIAAQLDHGAGAVAQVGAIVEDFRRSPTLLVFDNCEHVRGIVAELAVAFVQSSPNLKVLATSRSPLGVPEEHCLDLGPLAPESARSLLVDRAFGSAPTGIDPLDLDDLTAQLDLMPLHLELIAPALRTSTPKALVEQLRDSLDVASSVADSNPRHESLAAAIDSSVELLAAADRQLFDAIGVIRDGFAATDVASLLGQSPRQVRRQLSNLVTHSLLTIDRSSHPPRYRQAVAVRSHARGRLERAGLLTGAERSHTEFCLDAVTRLAPELLGPGEVEAVAELSRLGSQLDATHERLIRSNDAERSSRLSIGLATFALPRRDFPRIGWLTDTLGIPDVEDLDDYHELLATAAFMAWANNKFEESLRLCARAEKAARARSKPVPLKALQSRFMVSPYDSGKDDLLAALVDLSAEFERRGTPRERAGLAIVFTQGFAQAGRIEQAERSAQNAMALAVEADHPSTTARATWALGWARLATDPLAASRLFLASRRIASTVNNRIVEGMTTAALATSALRLGHYAQARSLLVDVIDLAERLNARRQLVLACREAVVLLAESGDEAGAAVVLGIVQLLDGGRRLLPEDHRRFERIAERLDLSTQVVAGDPLYQAGAIVRGLLLGEAPERPAQPE